MQSHKKHKNNLRNSNRRRKRTLKFLQKMILGKSNKSKRMDIDFDFSNIDLNADFAAMNMPDKFLGRFDIKEIKEALLETGIIERLLALGFATLHYRIDVRTENDHRLYIYHNEPSPKKMLVHLRVRHDYFSAHEDIHCHIPLEGCHLLLIDWLRLQNPKKKFSHTKKPYPGQYYPGLGLMNEMSLFIAHLAKKIGFDGIFNIPEYFHDAMLFTRYFRFLNPESEGKFLAIRRDLRHVDLRSLSAAIHENLLFNKTTDSIEPWSLGEQICPIQEPLLSYFSSKEYQRLCNESLKINKYELISSQSTPT